ncbi:uncharacterized protein F5Z01DRAFT_56619 [Emericellopsis atlantica]|uniref:DUF7605 domain-containing protein n=1 Tax=Emericellopsis atlantica TaxID=2614577 RepID=A0A9P7ZPS5_9HYPO|nr:uncharacterized protein F5Z01DRAFT_56619 [Emericellopsis atlantica]KAG9255485.1 hypothetical protein F5Z01DRAFT_56619 [Emericellopsis atlantica]
MPTPQAKREGQLLAEASPPSPSGSQSSTQSLFNSSNFSLDVPGPSSRTHPHGSHARSRSAGDSGNKITAFPFGQSMSSDFAPITPSGSSQARPAPFFWDSSRGARATAVERAANSPRPTNGQNGRHADVFLFGQDGKDAPTSTFSFGDLHNFSPLQSPRASPTIRHPKASLQVRSHNPSPGSSPAVTASVSGGFLSPPRLSLNNQSSPSISEINNRTRSLSLAEPRTETADALSTSLLPPSHSIVNSGDHPEAYDPRVEPGPTHEYFTIDFQQRLREGASIAKETVAAIEKVESAMKLDDEAGELLKQARELSAMRSDVTRTIAILGDSGEGQSRSLSGPLRLLVFLSADWLRKKQPHQLITSFSRPCTNGKSDYQNFVTLYKDLTKPHRQGDIGSACTSVVTEYRHKLERHTAAITIEVEYLSSDGIESLLRELLWSYRQLYLPLVEEAETSGKDYAKFQAESDHAWSTLSTAFGHQQSFSKDLLRDMSDGASERALDQLIRWSREIEWPVGGEQGRWTATATTAWDCCEKTRIFMQDRLWPFTKVIRMYLGSQILKTGVVLADLPGLQDTNLARVRSTQEYLMQCDNIFIVAKISRAVTNSSVKSSMYWALSRHAPMEWEQEAGRNFNISVVCTRSEDINIEAAKREFCGPGKQIATEVIARLEEEIEDAKRSSDRQRKKELKKRLEFLLIRARNAHVREGLQRAYSSEIPGGRLNVFCVSNKLYEKYSRKGPPEFIQETGIVELRRFCHSVTAEAQLKEGQHFLRSRLPSLLNSLGLWAGSRLSAHVVPPSTSTASLTESLERLKERAPQSISGFKKDFLESFDELIMSFFTSRDHQWDVSARTEAKKWETDWHWSNTPQPQVRIIGANDANTIDLAQYNAWCLRNGNHCTLKREATDWNAQIIWKMRMELNFQWDLVMEEVAAVFKAFQEDYTMGLMRMKAKVLEITESVDTEAMASLVTGIDSMISSWNYKVELMKQSFARDVEALRRRASESHSNSYILNEMVASYRSASSHSGGGKAARQKAIVGGKISGGTIFPNISIRLSTELHTLVGKKGQELNQLMSDSLRRLDNDVAMAVRLFSSENSVNRNNDPDAERLKAFKRQIDSLKAGQSTIVVV